MCDTHIGATLEEHTGHSPLVDEHVGEVAPRFVASRRIEDKRRVERHTGSGGHVVVLVVLQLDCVVDEDAELQ